MKTLNEIKLLMAAGDTAQADEALKELLAKEPDNLQAKMLLGLCCQLLGDEMTFKRIYDEVAPKMERLPPSEQRPETVTLWKKYHALWLSLIAGALVLADIAAVSYFGKTVKEQAMVATYAAYAGAKYDNNVKQATNADPVVPQEQIDVTSNKKFESPPPALRTGM